MGSIIIDVTGKIELFTMEYFELCNLRYKRQIEHKVLLKKLILKD